MSLAIHHSVQLPNGQPDPMLDGDEHGDNNKDHAPTWDHVIRSKGVLLAGGVTGIVELSKIGYAIKSPWPGPNNDECREEITLEARIYGILGPHDRLVKIQDWDPDECVLTMEYMPNGSLDNYLRTHSPNEISIDQRLQWALQTAQGLQLLHSAEIVHCDLKAKNLLLDSDLGLKIADFSGSSLRGSKTNCCAGVRYMLSDQMHGTDVDLFALGSVIYKIMTGMDPYEDIPSKAVQILYRQRQFPDITGVACGDIITGCWLGKFQLALHVFEALHAYISQVNFKGM